MCPCTSRRNQAARDGIGGKVRTAVAKTGADIVDTNGKQCSVVRSEAPKHLPPVLSRTWNQAARWLALALPSLLAMACLEPQQRPSDAGFAAQPSDSDLAFLTQYAETWRFTRGLPKAIKITPGGDEVLYLRSGPRSPVQDLYAFDTVSGQERVLLTAEQILQGAAEKLSVAELARRERQRQSARGIATYQLSEDGNRLLVPLSSRLFVIERETGRITELPDEGGVPIDARMSPDGRHVACVRSGDLYVMDIDSQTQKRLTHRPDEHVTNGLSEFIAQEEMDRDAGYWWSPDSRRIVYQQTDVSPVETLYIADAMQPAAPPTAWPYPRAGRNNANVRLGIIPAAGGETVWVDWDRDKYEYLATVRWQEDSPLTLVVQNRQQTDLAIMTVDAASGATQVIHQEHDPAWINLDQDMPRWLPGRNAFLWTSQRYGDWVLEERTPGSEEPRFIAPNGKANYRGFISMNRAGTELAILVDRAGQAEPHPTERHVAIVRYDAQRNEWSAPQTDAHEAAGKWSAAYAPDHQASVRWCLRVNEQPDYEVRRADGTKIGDMPKTADQPPFDVNVEFTSVDLGERYYAAIVRPHDFVKGKQYPVIEHVYGGPGYCQVEISGERLTLDQWFADHGFIVVRIDGHGTPNRGRSWERSIKGNLIHGPLQDHVSVLAALAKRYPELDMNRVGIHGWSFGGYFSAMAVMQQPDVYRAAVAGAPVADWLDYDTHYTERYLALPQNNPEGYRYSSVLNFCDELRRPLMLIHGTTDDNVYFTNSLQISNALFRAGIPHNFLPLSNFTHMVADPLVTVRINLAIENFFRQHLGSR